MGDFNVDVSRQSAFTHHLSTLMTSLDLIACDLHSNTITYTHERDGGSVRSWKDHVLCNESYSNLINQLHPMNSGIKGAIARVVRVRTGNGPIALVNSMFPLWSCSFSLTTAMLHKED